MKPRITVITLGVNWGGYAGCFQDPDGHLWEVVWNPQFEITESPRPSSSA